MSTKTILIANRGEIAVRILHAVAELGWRSLLVYAEDDQHSLAVYQADVAVPLRGVGASAYLDQQQIIAIARQHQCDAVHPGYGFLSENAEFARQVQDAGLVFVGPDADVLALFGDKARARALALQCGVPVLPGIDHAVTLTEAKAFFADLQMGAAMVIKAVAGGGGRGMRVVASADEIEAAFARCQSEAQAAFGNGSVYVEQCAALARHIEIQIVGDGVECVHVHERECTLQRRHQKLIEVAPSPSLGNALRTRIIDAALTLAQAIHYRSLGTFEFLVFGIPGEEQFVFIEANPRLQVEHTVTEAITGLDLVQLQLRLALGANLAQLGLLQPAIPAPRGFAVQLRVNMETLLADGTVKPGGGVISRFDLPAGPGVRVDTFGYQGYATTPRYDSLLAKIIVHSSGDFAAALAKAWRALCECRIDGVPTNLPLLKNLLQHDDVLANRIHTRFIDQQLADLLLEQVHPQRSPQTQLPVAAAANLDNAATEHALYAPMQGTVVAVDVTNGTRVRKGQTLLILDAMKMEHVIAAPHAGIVQGCALKKGDAVMEQHMLLQLIPTESDDSEAVVTDIIDPDFIRPDLAEVIDRHAFGYDENRPDAVAKRRATGQRTARENIADLCDADSFVEYGPLAIAAQRRRRTLQDLIEKTPGDGMVCGIGRVNGDQFGDAGQCVLMTYDYTVMAGTQGIQNHRKKDRMFELAQQWQLPVVLFSEGGGGRPGDTDGLGSSASLDCLAFFLFAKLSGLVPLVGIASGRNFAGNAALLGCCDVVIATRNANIGMGGPAMIEGGGLGVYAPEQVGPTSVQVQNGVIDLLAEDEADAVRVAKHYLSFFQGDLAHWQAPDQRLLRTLIPENRLRAYDVRAVIHGLADCDSVLEPRAQFGLGMITAFARVEGRAVGIIANNPQYLAGAIDAPGADKAARFMQLCDGFDIPILFLCDTPGIMVGPEVEKTALVRHVSRLFVTAASITVPFFTIVLRKAYGLGAMTMAGGTLKAPLFTVSWPTGEFGAMGLEGAVKLGFRKELEAVSDPQQRDELFRTMVADMYERGKAVNNATFFEFDDVIDPAQSRQWIMTALRSAPAPAKRKGKKRPCIDTW